MAEYNNFGELLPIKLNTTHADESVPTTHRTFADIEIMKVAKPEMLEKSLANSRRLRKTRGNVDKKGFYSHMNTEITTLCKIFSSFFIQKSTKKGS